VRRRLARILRKLREGAGLTIEQVADKVELSPSTISRMETAQVGVRPNDLRPLLELYNVSDVQREELMQLARKGRQQVWWQEYKDVPTAAVASREDDAESILQYAAQVVPGLLQTEEYAREVLHAIHHYQAGPEKLARRLEARLARQALLTGKDAPRYWVVLDEAVLRRVIGGRQVMHAQLQRLIDAAELPNVTLQVLPFSVGAHAALDGDFTILRYRDPEDPDVVFIENTGVDAYLEDPAVTRRYNSIFEHLRMAAQNQAESVRTLADAQHHLLEAEGS
jgi:transcriptional regulator with XRE-family HTH domain